MEIWGSKHKIEPTNFKIKIIKEMTSLKLTDKAPPNGDNDKLSTVALNSSTLAEIGAIPLFSGLISTRIFRSCSSCSESLSESE